MRRLLVLEKLRVHRRTQLFGDLGCEVDGAALSVAFRRGAAARIPIAKSGARRGSATLQTLVVSSRRPTPEENGHTC